MLRVFCVLLAQWPCQKHACSMMLWIAFTILIGSPVGQSHEGSVSQRQPRGGRPPCASALEARYPHLSWSPSSPPGLVPGVYPSPSLRYPTKMYHHLRDAVNTEDHAHLIIWTGTS
ncbi:hypothetical protein BX666DRAFT_423233 [Dichotomocladium elegans]|nr:hypothetical protein BX666DRAFT_423233 [Dichotomocladium elegans]